MGAPRASGPLLVEAASPSSPDCTRCVYCGDCGRRSSTGTSSMRICGRSSPRQCVHAGVRSPSRPRRSCIGRCRSWRSIERSGARCRRVRYCVRRRRILARGTALSPPAVHSSSALSDEERIAARRRHLISCGASSVRAGTAFVKAWIEFCSRRDIRDYGVPPDADLLSAFLADVDTAARSRAVHRSKQTGASVQHAMACAARWVTDHAGLPFDIAKSRQVRKASAPAREVDPGWSAMWEPAILVHLLRVALHEQHRGLVRAVAAAAYFVCAASMRLINGLRSGPPVLDSQGVFHGIAALSKGRRRSTMAPRPWCVPSVSPDGETSDSAVRCGLQSAIAQLPQGCCSMFPRLVDADGREVALERAVAASPTARAADAQLETTVMYLPTRRGRPTIPGSAS
ncbi:hypothetical protein AB1Y20_019765 [Prymnesium parvum]|uniref:Core-binding (CB) domain-containing protein n=1 Tax=Prymnesium parvum TaxID=97485 RepID=A0AB34JS08_PRYPA